MTYSMNMGFITKSRDQGPGATSVVPLYSPISPLTIGTWRGHPCNY